MFIPSVTLKFPYQQPFTNNPYKLLTRKEALKMVHKS